MEEKKKPWQSKSVWASLIVAASAFYPPVQDWIKEHPEAFSGILGSIFLGLRLITNKKISIK